MVDPERETGKGADVKSASSAVASGSGEASAGLFGLADWMRDMPNVQQFAVMQNPAVVFAAATAIGIGMTNHFASVMLGVMREMAGPTPVRTDAFSPAARETETRRIRTKAPAAPANTVANEAKPMKLGTPRGRKAAGVATRPADDLKRISGIGPKLEQVLNGLGVQCYADVASLSETDVKRLDEQLGFGGRILRDGWIEQAKALMTG